MIQMTRAEYQAKYGSQPSPQPIQMTRQQYQQKYGALPTQKENWLTGNAQSFGGKVLNAAGNILNVPSYAIGGILNNFQKGNFNPITGAIEGVKNKQAVMTELPETLGMDPNSTAGKVLGFGGELLTPTLPIGKIAKGLGLANKGSKAVSVANKAGGLSEVGKDLLLRSYKFSQTDIAKLANNLGETNPARYKDVVVNFLQKQGLKGGATQQGMESVSKVIEPIQAQYNALVRTGKQIDPRIYARQISEQASAILSNPLSSADEISIAKALQAEAKRISGLKSPITDTMLTAKKSGSFAGVPASKINDPYLMSRQKAMGQAGIKALEEISPGSQAVGRQLKGLRTAQEVIGRTANVGKGTQLINTLKPFIPGATGAFVLSGGNPIIAGAGAIAATMANNPAIQNKMARSTLSFASRSGSDKARKGLNLFRKGLSKTASTGVRVSMQSKEQSTPKPQVVTIPKTQTTYDPITTVIQQLENRRKNYVPAAFPTVKRR